MGRVGRLSRNNDRNKSIEWIKLRERGAAYIAKYLNRRFTIRLYSYPDRPKRKMWEIVETGISEGKYFKEILATYVDEYAFGYINDIIKEHCYRNPWIRKGELI